MRNVLVLIALVLFLGTLNLARGDEIQKTHFENANAYTVKIRSRVEYPFLKDERGSFAGAGFCQYRDDVAWHGFRTRTRRQAWL